MSGSEYFWQYTAGGADNGRRRRGRAVREWQVRRNLLTDGLNGLNKLPFVVAGGGWSLLLDAEALGMRAPELS
jgi:hypothetical protein